MSTLQLSVILIGALCLLNTVAVAALIRQVGVLHLRIKPVAGMPGAGGPAFGSELALPASLNELAHRSAERFIIGFMSPTCGLCGELTTAFGKIAKSADAGTAVVLVVDSSDKDAREYLQSKHVDFLPYVADKSVFAANKVPGAPWAIVTDEMGRVMASGGINTLDNVEQMMVHAEEMIANPPMPLRGAEQGLDQPIGQPVEVN